MRGKRRKLRVKAALLAAIWLSQVVIGEPGAARVLAAEDELIIEALEYLDTGAQAGDAGKTAPSDTNGAGSSGASDVGGTASSGTNGAAPSGTTSPGDVSADFSDIPLIDESERPSTDTPPTGGQSDTPATDTPGIGLDGIHAVGGDRVYLGIDNRHAYDGMEQSFAEGYVPTVEDQAFSLVVPITAGGALKDEKLTVDLQFESGSETAFQYKNYQKDVKKATYTFDTETGQEQVEAYVYRCTVELQAGAPSGQYAVTVKAFGYTEDGEKLTLDYRIFIRVPEQETEAASGDAGGGGSLGDGGYTGGGGGGATAEEIIHQPKMLLESCSLSGEALEAGSEETLEVSFRNRSQSQSMYNLKVVLSAASTGVVLERNSFYFSKVSPGEEISLSEQISIAKDAEAASVPLTFTFEYEDSKGTASTGTETVNLYVVQPVRMELETAEIPAILYASDTVSIPVRALNLSRTGVYNARIGISGTGLFPTGEAFLGNMEAGSQGEGTITLYVGTRTMEAVGIETGTDDQEKYGPVSGVITLQYEDAAGTVYEETREYQAEIKKAQILSLKVEAEEEANDWWVSIFAVAGLAMIVWILLLTGRLRRKNVLLLEARKEAGYER